MQNKHPDASQYGCSNESSTTNPDEKCVRSLENSTSHKQKNVLGVVIEKNESKTEKTKTTTAIQPNGLVSSSPRVLNVVLLDELMSRFPALNPKSAKKKVDLYVSVMLREIGQTIGSFGFQDGQISLPLDQIRAEVDRIRVNDKSEYAVPLFHKDPKTSLILIDFRGNEGRNSRVSLNPMYAKDIENELINLNYELSAARLKELNDNANNQVPVDPDSLESFIKKTLETFNNLDGTEHPGYKEKLIRNMQISRQLKDSIFEEDGSYWLKEQWEFKDSGRAYGKGLSLQRIDKEVRNAALGYCHKYDFMASSFALMTGVAMCLERSKKFTAINEYIKDRSEIRKRIAKEIGISEKWMKDIFTSLGFGASTANSYYTSIKGKLGEVKYQALMANKDFKYIAEETDEVRDIVYKQFKGLDTFEFMDQTYSEIDPNTGKKRTKNQLLAWVYQAMESYAVSEFSRLANEKGHTPIMWAHDCLYYKEPLSPDLVDNIMYQLNETFPLLQVEHERVVPIHTKDFVDSRYAALDAETEAHQQRIAAETRKANKGKAQPKVDELDPETGYFADVIKALNGSQSGKNLGSTFEVPEDEE